MDEPLYLSRTRAAYDTVASDYADLLSDALAAGPYDRAVLGVFAELVGNAGPVADIGCGPGRITAHLRTLGVPAIGIDLSPAMVDAARRGYPDTDFKVGSMTDLQLPDGELAGIVAWYSVIHLPPDQRPLAFAEFHRSLRPGGLLQLAFQVGSGSVGDQLVRIERAYGHDITLDAYRLSPAGIGDQLQQSGFTVQATLVRRPTGQEKVDQAYLLARTDS